MAGLIKGFGKGIGGVVLKPGAGKEFKLMTLDVTRLIGKLSGDFLASRLWGSIKNFRNYSGLAFRTISLRLARRKDTKTGEIPPTKNVVPS